MRTTITLPEVIAQDKNFPKDENSKLVFGNKFTLKFSPILATFSVYQGKKVDIYLTFLERRAFIRSAFLVFITPLLAALSTAEKALLSESSVNNERKLSIAVLALVFVALL